MDIVQVKEEKEIVLVGIGMGSPGQITIEGIEALLYSDAWMGASRMIESGKAVCRHVLTKPFFENQHVISLEDKQFCITYHPEEMLDWLSSHSQVRRPAVLYSGDVGFYSGAKGFTGRLKEGHRSYVCRMIPGISSLSYFAAKIGRSWEGLEQRVFTAGKKGWTGGFWTEGSGLFCWTEAGVFMKSAAVCWSMGKRKPVYGQGNGFLTQKSGLSAARPRKSFLWSLILF